MSKQRLEAEALEVFKKFGEVRNISVKEGKLSIFAIFVFLHIIGNNNDTQNPPVVLVDALCWSACNTLKMQRG